jgi:hypothetical protein
LVYQKVNLGSQLGGVHAFEFMDLLSAMVGFYKQRSKSNHTRTFFPSKKNKNVGVTLTLHSLATLEPIPTSKSTFVNAMPSPLLARVFAPASSSKTGAIILHGPQLVAVKNATTTRCEPKTEWKEDGFVLICIGEASVCVAGVGVGVEGDVGAGVGR